MTAQDLSVVDRLLGQFEREVGGSHNRMCDAAQQIALEGGMPDAEGLIRAMAANPNAFDELAQRPWTRLLGVATEASERGDSLLVARICWFAHFYCDQFMKTLSRADVGWVNLFEANSAVRAAIAALGVGQLSALQPEEAVCADSTGAGLPWRIVATVCATDVLTHDPSGSYVSPDILARARALINGSEPNRSP